ncbi:uncharacterized protein [Engystomops pustulosus]|uniref:uncharacterized protein n=1 Tax=Engystomops pustulosus TaxID=76066 RepID=UPI003AFB67EC
MDIVDVDGALYDEELQSLSYTLGNSKVLVVLDDLENCSASERQKIVKRQPSLRYRSSEILLFPQTGKIEEATKKEEDFRKVFGNNAASMELRTNINLPKGPSSRLSLSTAPVTKTPSVKSKKRISLPNISASSSEPVEVKVSIFSRSAQRNYEWLMDWLKTTCVVRPEDVHAVCITNSSTAFYSELPNCSFAILYHTLKHGALNITDVSDSLYDDELKSLSQYHGKENVIVVIDDLEHDSPDEKKWILVNQPSIRTLAQDLFLFDEKKSRKNINLENMKQIIRKEPPSDEMTGPDYPWADFERNPITSSTSSAYLDQERYVKVLADNQPTSYSKERGFSDYPRVDFGRNIATRLDQECYEEVKDDDKQTPYRKERYFSDYPRADFERNFTTYPDQECYEEPIADDQPTSYDYPRADFERNFTTYPDQECYEEPIADDQPTSYDYPRATFGRNPTTYPDQECYEEPIADNKPTPCNYPRADFERNFTTYPDQECYEEPIADDQPTSYDYPRADFERNSITSSTSSEDLERYLEETAYSCTQPTSYTTERDSSNTYSVRTTTERTKTSLAGSTAAHVGVDCTSQDSSHDIDNDLWEDFQRFQQSLEKRQEKQQSKTEESDIVLLQERRVNENPQRRVDNPRMKERPIVEDRNTTPWSSHMDTVIQELLEKFKEKKLYK